MMEYIILTFLNICILNLIFLKLEFNNSILSLISSYFYILPVFRIFNNLKRILNIKINKNFEYLISKKWNKKLAFYFKTKKKKKIKKYKFLLLIIILYILLIPQYYSKNFVSYTIKYNFLHLLVLLGLQTVLFYIYKKFMKKQIKYYLFKNSIYNLIILGFIINLFLLFYCALFAINNIYVEIPFISSNCKTHKFMVNNTP